jgi:hypothetical protein
MSCPSHPPWLDNCNYICRREQVVKFFIMQFLSNLLFPHPSSVQIFSSALFSNTHRICSSLNVRDGRAVAQRLDAGFPPRRSGFAYGQRVGFVVDKAALGHVFSEYFGFPCQSFHRFLHHHNHPGLT